MTTLNSVKDQGGIPRTDTSRDAQLLSFIAGLSALAKTELNRDIELTTQTEYYSGDNSSILILRKYPIVSVAGVWEDGGAWFNQAENAFDSSTQLVQGIDWCIMQGQRGVGSNGMLLRIGATWPGRPSRVVGLVSDQPPLPNGNIKVTYTAGLAALPAVAMAINGAVLKMATMAEAGGAVQSESYQDASQSYFSPELALKVFGSIEQTLSKYKSISI